MRTLWLRSLAGVFLGIAMMTIVMIAAPPPACAWDDDWVWGGNFSNDWNDPNNWDRQSVPSYAEYSYVIIYGGTPHISLGTVAECRSTEGSGNIILEDGTADSYATFAPYEQGYTQDITIGAYGQVWNVGNGGFYVSGNLSMGDHAVFYGQLSTYGNLIMNGYEHDLYLGPAPFSLNTLTVGSSSSTTVSLLDNVEYRELGITANYEYITSPSGGTGTFIQTYSPNTVNNDLVLGSSTGGNGIYTQTGGVNAVYGNLVLGQETGSTGTYNYQGGTLYVGNDITTGSGTSTLNIGTTSPDITVSGGDISVTNFKVGTGPSGKFVQNWINVSVADDLVIGDNGCEGTYDYQGGTLQVGGNIASGEYGYSTLNINADSTGGNITVSGGNIKVTNFNVGNTYTGAFTLETGNTLTASNITVTSGTFGFTGGTLSVGTFNGNLTVGSGGTLSPGSSPGYTTVNGNFDNSGKIIFELGNSGSDVIQVNGGNVTLGGVLQLKPWNGFTPSVGNYFDVITWWGGYTFTDNGYTIDNDFGGGIGFAPSVEGTSLRLTACYADIYWDVSSGEWATNGNWDPPGAPTSGTDAHINNSGTATVSTGDNTSNHIVIGSGTLELTGGTLSARGVINGSGTGTINIDGGALNVTAGTIDVDNLNIGNSSPGAFALETGNTLKANNITVSSGTFNFNGGTLSVGTFNGDLTVGSGGTLSPGTSPGLTTVNGNFINAGTILFELGGTGTPGTNYDAIDVNSGNVTLGGVLQLKPWNGFTPSVGSYFDVLSWDEGYTFTDNGYTIDNDFGGGITFAPSVVGTSLRLTSDFGLFWNVYSGNWATVGNWDPSQTPTSSTDVYINNGGISNVTTTANADVVTIGSGTLNINSGGTLNATSIAGRGAINIDGGALAVSGGTISAQYFNVGNAASKTGSFTLAGDKQITADTEYIGNYGTGVFTQSGGTNQGAYVSVGYQAASRGTYNLEGGALIANSVNLGEYGTGIFNQTGGVNQHMSMFLGAYSGSKGRYVQSGGTHDLTYLNIAVFDGSMGTYELSGTGFLKAFTQVGNRGTGYFTQTGGTNQLYGSLAIGNYSGSKGLYVQSGGAITTFSNQSMEIGSGAGSIGTYELSGTGVINLSTNDERIGIMGTGAFTQSGGTNKVANVYLGSYLGGRGTYTQTGGTANIMTALYVGYASTSRGTYGLSGTGVLNASGVTEYIGYYSGATGTFTQSGGTNQAASLYVGYNSGSQGTYTQSGGTATVTNLYLANKTGSTGTYNLQGGKLSASSISRGYGTSSLNVTGGILSVATFNGGLTIGGGGTLSPGEDALGLTTVNGVFNNAGTLLFQIGGTGTPGTNYDAIDVNGGNITLGGILQLVPWNGFTPSAGNYFDVISWDYPAYTFTNNGYTIDNDFSGGLTFTPSLGNGYLRLTASYPDFYWNASSGDWATSSNWNPPSTPGSGSDAYIDNSGTSNITTAANADVVTIGAGTLNLNSGGTLNATSIVNSGSGTGTVNVDGGALVVSSSIAADNFNVGNAAATNGSFTLADGHVLSATNAKIGNAGTGILTLAGGTLSGSNLTVRNTSDAAGTFQGTGAVDMSGTLTNNGRIIADGGTLDMSGFASVTSTIENPATGGTNGWFATDEGKLILPSITVATGTNTYTWGESSGDSMIDLVNSLRVTFHNVTSGGSFEISLLALDNPDAPVVTNGTGFGLWDFEATGLAFASADIIFRYDDSLTGNLVALTKKMYHKKDSIWYKHDIILDEGNNLITVLGLTSFSPLLGGGQTPAQQGSGPILLDGQDPPYEGGEIPEPVTVLSFIAGIFMLGFRKLMKRKK